MLPGASVIKVELKRDDVLKHLRLCEANAELSGAHRVVERGEILDFTDGEVDIATWDISTWEWGAHFRHQAAWRQ